MRKFQHRASFVELEFLKQVGIGIDFGIIGRMNFARRLRRKRRTRDWIAFRLICHLRLLFESITLQLTTRVYIHMVMDKRWRENLWMRVSLVHEGGDM